MSEQHTNSLPDCPPLEQSFVRLIQELRYESLDDAALAGIDRLMRDQLALQIGISQMPWSQQVLSFALSHKSSGNSHVAASNVTMSASDAAFVNATYGHGFEYDDAHGASASHPGSCVIPAALAIGEELGATMEEVITAVVAGYEVYTRIGVLAAPDLLKRGFHPHSILSAFGAAAVAAKLRKFDAETTLHALSIALSHTSGTSEYSSTGGSIKRVHAGIGTRNGIAAADMAQAGLTGPHAFLSGNKGFFRAFLQRGPGESAVLQFEKGRPLEISTVWLKAYCACYCTHAYIDAVRPFSGRLRDIGEIQARLQPTFNVIVGESNANAYNPKNIENVQFSLPVQIAFALLGMGNGYKVHRDYMDGKVDMKAVMDVVHRVKIIEAPELEQNYPGKFVADVTVMLKDGTSEHVFVEDPIGTLANPMPEDMQDAKFMELTRDVIGNDRAQTLLNTLRSLPLQTKAEKLMMMCTK